MKITLISHSDLRGGAAVVTFRLMEAFRRLGVDARMLVMRPESDSEFVEQVGNRLSRKGVFLAERMEIFAQNGFSRGNLFKVSSATFGFDLSRHPLVRDADAIILGWFNQGLLSLGALEKIIATGKPVAWTLHDMWAFTGICHHSLGCRRFEHGCGNCPLLGAGGGKRDLSARIFARKSKLYSKGNIRFVPVSSWLAAEAEKSPLMKGQNITVIPNAFPVEEFSTVKDNRVIEELGLPAGRNLILMGAARLDDPIKDLPAAIEALNILADNKDIAENTMAVMFGGLRNPEILGSLFFPHKWVGPITDAATLRGLYSSAQVVVSSSKFETLPGTLIEGQAAGAIPVTFGDGGQRDIIDHLGSGYIASEHTPQALARGIEWALSQEIPREFLHGEVARKFSAATVARRFLGLLQ